MKTLISYNNNGYIITTIDTSDNTLQLDKTLNWLDITNRKDKDSIISNKNNFRIRSGAIIPLTEKQKITPIQPQQTK